MRRNLSILAALPCAVGISFGLAIGQTVTVASDGTGDYESLQDAIASEPEIVQIVDDGAYEGHVSISQAITIEGTGEDRPTLLLQQGGGSTHGIQITITDESVAHDVTLRNLILLPSEEDTPVRGIQAGGANQNLLLENLLITVNDGAGNPITTDGLEELDLNDFPDRVEFGDDGMLVGGGGPGGPGTTVTFRDVVISHLQVGSSPDGIILSAGQPDTNFIFEDGNVVSYCGRFGIQAGRNFQVNAPEQRLMVLGNTRSNIWYTGNDGTVDDLVIDGVVSVGSSEWGLQHQVGASPMNLIVRNSIFVGNNNGGILVGGAASSAAHSVQVENVTSARNDGPSFLVFSAGYEAPITIQSSVLAGDGTDDADNVIRHSGTGPFTIESSAIVTAGPDRLNSDPIDDVNDEVSTFAIVSADPVFDPTDDPSHENYFQVTNIGDYDGQAFDGSFLRGGAPAPEVEPTPTPTPTPVPLHNPSWEHYQ